MAQQEVINLLKTGDFSTMEISKKLGINKTSAGRNLRALKRAGMVKSYTPPGIKTYRKNKLISVSPRYSEMKEKDRFNTFI